MTINRRDFIKTQAIAAAAATAGISRLPSLPRRMPPATADTENATAVRWDKAPAASAAPAARCWSACRTAAWWPPRAIRMRRSIAA
jgi:hypothetical protein